MGDGVRTVWSAFAGRENRPNTARAKTVSNFGTVSNVDTCVANRSHRHVPRARHGTAGRA
eukprot:3510377-Prymnesium_polylepis.1